MSFPALDIVENKKHWSYSDNFGMAEYEYIKSFLHENYTIGYHTHDFYELNVVLSGDGYHYIEEMPYRAEAGCVFLIPPNVRHGYISKSSLNVYHMLIHRRFLEECFAELKQTDGFFLLFETEPYLRAHHKQKMFLVLSGSELNVLKQDINAIKSALSLPFSNAYVNAIAKKILAGLCMTFELRSKHEYRAQEAKNDFDGIVDCLNYIHQFYYERLTIEQLAKRANLSRSTFIRQFTSICGCSPHHYIHQHRIKKAKELLAAGDKSASWIAQECGFYDASHMRKCLMSNPEKAE